MASYKYERYLVKNNNKKTNIETGKDNKCAFCNCFFPKDRFVCPNLRCNAYRTSEDDIGKNAYEREELLEEFTLKKILKENGE